MSVFSIPFRWFMDDVTRRLDQALRKATPGRKINGEIQNAGTFYRIVVKSQPDASISLADVMAQYVSDRRLRFEGKVTQAEVAAIVKEFEDETQKAVR